MVIKTWYHGKPAARSAACNDATHILRELQGRKGVIQFIQQFCDQPADIDENTLKQLVTGRWTPGYVHFFHPCKHIVY